jgi:hypothetical protein
MYRVGFGDCFLVSFSDDRHVLVDCGVHAIGDIGTLDDVIDDVAKATDRRLALVIASHPHEDHISGFARGEATFRTFEIGEIWLPWTEDPADPRARRLRKARAQLIAGLTAHAAAAPLPAAAAAVLANAASGRNQVALDLLRSGFGTDAVVRFLAGGASFDDACGIPGLRARALAPPQEEDDLKAMDPPRSERYLTAVEDGSRDWVGAVTPFGPEWIDDEGLGPRLVERERRRLVRSVESSPDALAFALDRAVNNTSLVLLFTYGGRSLLFPGDAQYGSWRSWLRHDDASAVLESIAFYKVSHHGSENATPKSALEGMRNERLAAMASTQGRPWPSIPHGPLWAALESRTQGRSIRSDVVPITGAPDATAATAVGFERGPFWIDHVVDP